MTKKILRSSALQLAHAAMLLPLLGWGVIWRLARLSS